MKPKNSQEEIRKKYQPICMIFGSSACKPKSELYSFAEKLGSIVARNGFTVANGGYDGTMDAAAKGARNAGGSVIGITTDEITRCDPSTYLTEEFREPTLMGRLEICLTIADVFIALPGSIGTLAEMVLAWNKLELGLIHARPLIAVDQKWKKIFDLMFAEDPLVPKSTWKKDSKIVEVSTFVETIEEIDNILQNLSTNISN